MCWLYICVYCRLTYTSEAYIHIYQYTNRYRSCHTEGNNNNNNSYILAMFITWYPHCVCVPLLTISISFSVPTLHLSLKKKETKKIKRISELLFALWQYTQFRHTIKNLNKFITYISVCVYIYMYMYMYVCIYIYLSPLASICPHSPQIDQFQSNK